MRGGSSYVVSPPAFSNDGKYLLVCTANIVSIFSTSTALQVASLEGHTGPVTSVIVVPGSKILCYCWTASLDGSIRYWDFSVPELIKKLNVNMPIFSMVIPSIRGQPAESNEKPTDVFAYMSVEDKKVQENRPKAMHGQIRKCFAIPNSLLMPMNSGLNGISSHCKNRVEGEVMDSRSIDSVCLVSIMKDEACLIAPRHEQKLLSLLGTPQPESITVSPSGKFFGIRNNRKLHVWSVPTTDSGRVLAKKITLHHTKTLNVLAFHPTERIIAAGDVSGRILVWRGFGCQTFSTGDELANKEEERPGVRGNDDADSCSTWHWHSAEVKVLSFSSDGAYLYSGGKEGVLVVWQLDTGKKKFLPRIGSPLLYFTDSPDPTLSSISCADNQIHILKMPSMDVLKSISGIKLPYSFPGRYEALRSGFAFDYASGLVALRTESYGIQFYSLFDDHGIYEVQVCERNHQPGDEITVVVNLVALSQDGSMMSTAEVRLPEEGIGGLVCLKFWASGSENKKFTLSTVIYEPHRDAGISAVAFHPIRHMAVSSSYGGDFKIWVCNDIQQKDQMSQNSGWACLAVGAYKKKPMTAAAFSSDGSVLAVAAETVITLWDPDKNVLVAVIGETSTCKAPVWWDFARVASAFQEQKLPSSHLPIVTLSFAGKSEYLLSVSRGSKPQLSVWNMSKLSLSWSYRLHIEAVACAVDLLSFAVLALLPESSICMESNESMSQGRDGVILLFNVMDPVPVSTWSVRKV
uniref:WD repeat-containing protein 75 second beta-propeller domain-containing protein n=1 Tax=Fagus sylvatica TaxID=28930 RepID=A0A2N9I1K3_FAGSY